MQQRISLQPADGGLALDTSFDRTFLDAFKATVPYSDRTWDAARKRWIIAHEKAPEICRLVEQYFGVRLQIPQAGPAAAAELRVLRVEYVGRCKARNDNDPVALRTASGYLGQHDRSLIFPEPVLRAWFQDDLEDATPAAAQEPRKPAGPQTLYRVLTVKQTATPEELKKAYRQLARQWHPDVCKEQDAHEQFLRIKHAYDVLGDAKSRRKYDAGLKLEASLTTNHDPFRPYGRPKNMAVQRHDDQTLGYRSPLRCGMLVVEGTPRVGQFVVSKILRWDDVVRDDGKTMVSSWPSYGDAYEVNWV